MKVGITGHQDLGRDTRSLLAPILRDRLASASDLEGLSSLAVGADQLFAEVVLALGGRLIVIVPSDDYADGFRPEDRAAFEMFLSDATEVVRLQNERASEQAYWEAGRRIVDGCDLLIAIWDSRPSAGLGGTADVVAYAHKGGTPVDVIWPAGARRG